MTHLSTTRRLTRMKTTCAGEGLRAGERAGCWACGQAGLLVMGRLGGHGGMQRMAGSGGAAGSRRRPVLTLLASPFCFPSCPRPWLLWACLMQRGPELAKHPVGAALPSPLLRFAEPSPAFAAPVFPPISPLCCRYLGLFEGVAPPSNMLVLGTTAVVSDNQPVFWRNITQSDLIFKWVFSWTCLFTC